MSNLSLNQMARLEYLRFELVKTQCYVNYWVNFASSETNKNRVVFYGGASKEFQGKQFTDLELEKEAFDTALNHIRRIEDLQKEIAVILS